ncbi:unnamed protein product [Rhizopus stolonifer]
MKACVIFFAFLLNLTLVLTQTVPLVKRMNSRKNVEKRAGPRTVVWISLFFIGVGSCAIIKRDIPDAYKTTKIAESGAMSAAFSAKGTTDSVLDQVHQGLPDIPSGLQ